ncbi:MAG: exosortase T [Deltaproteobacteria bacterium]|nr:exosortase T [Deltaproteobacteria bacterium]
MELLGRALALLGVTLLAIHPATWLVTTWLDPSYASRGWMAFLACVALFVRSVRSEGPGGSAKEKSLAGALLFATALARAAGELLAVRTIGAIGLVIDVYALGLATGLRSRSRPVCPAGLAFLFAFSLPCDRLVERALGHPMQLISAKLACAALGVLHDGLVCQGTQIFLPPAQLSVDLPCSGSRGLVLCLAVFAAALASRRLSARRAFAGALAAGSGALTANSMRLVATAVLTAGGFDAMAEPLHSVIGASTLFISTLPLGLLLRPPPPPTRTHERPESWAPSLSAGLTLVITAVTALVLPSRPIDAVPSEPVTLPVSLGGGWSEAIPLDSKEELYFSGFGGTASKRRYFDAGGSFTVVVVRTHSPLRHLHSPDECLRGSGHSAKLSGVRSDLTSVYSSKDPDGMSWSVEVNFFGDDGHVAATPAEVIWRWLERRDVAWTMVERITPEGFCDSNSVLCERRRRTLFAALELPRRPAAKLINTSSGVLARRE